MAILHVEFSSKLLHLQVPSEEKTEAIQLEYTCLLTSQLENQRKFFENKLKEAEQRAEKFEVFANAQVCGAISYWKFLALVSLFLFKTSKRK